MTATVYYCKKCRKQSGLSATLTMRQSALTGEWKTPDDTEIVPNWCDHCEIVDPELTYVTRVQIVPTLCSEGYWLSTWSVEQGVEHALDFNGYTFKREEGKAAVLLDKDRRGLTELLTKFPYDRHSLCKHYI